MFGVPSESFDSIRDEARSHPKTAWVSWIREEEQKRYGPPMRQLLSLIDTQAGLCPVHPRR